jgi:hypothetical protein
MLPLIGFGSPRLGRNSRFLYGWSLGTESIPRTSSEERVSCCWTATLNALCVTCTAKRRLITCCFSAPSVHIAGVMWVSTRIMVLTSFRWLMRRRVLLAIVSLWKFWRLCFGAFGSRGMTSSLGMRLLLFLLGDAVSTTC